MRYRFRIVREGGLFFIQKLTNGNRWVIFPNLRKDNSFPTAAHAERWLVEHENWRLVEQRELIKEIFIDTENQNLKTEKKL